MLHGRDAVRFAVRNGCVALVVAAVVSASTAAAEASATQVHAARRSTWVRPVDEEVVRPFQAPPHHYGPGHRGVDLSAPPGTAVVAAGDGIVAFAGAVVRDHVVTIVHPKPGWRTTYSNLARVDVRTGQRVHAGDRIGVAGGALAAHHNVVHFGLRVHGEYVDPMRVLGFEWRTVRLVAADSTATDPTPAPNARPRRTLHGPGSAPAAGNALRVRPQWPVTLLARTVIRQFVQRLITRSLPRGGLAS